MLFEGVTTYASKSTRLYSFFRWCQSVSLPKTVRDVYKQSYLAETPPSDLNVFKNWKDNVAMEPDD